MMSGTGMASGMTMAVSPEPPPQRVPSDKMIPPFEGVEFDHVVALVAASSIDDVAVKTILDQLVIVVKLADDEAYEIARRRVIRIFMDQRQHMDRLRTYEERERDARMKTMIAEKSKAREKEEYKTSMFERLKKYMENK